MNDIRWGAVDDDSDPYVIEEYTIGWKAVDAEQMYYDVDDPNGGDCYEGGCDGDEISDEDTMVTVYAPGTANREVVLGYDETASYYCWVFFTDFNPNYGENNPIYVLECYYDSDCSANQYCDKSGSWDDWDCISKKSDGQSCTAGNQCSSGYCDNDGEGLSDDNHCFTPYNTYFDGQETSYCEYSTGNGIVDCDERQNGDDLNMCIGAAYYEEECSNTCAYQDVTSVFECTDTGCNCSEILCDEKTTGSNISTCASGQTYFADKCTSTAGGEDRTDNICRSSSFDSVCTASSECDGIEAGTDNCNPNCTLIASPNITIISLKDIYSNNTFKVFEFVIKNNGGSALNITNWGMDFDDGNAVINSYTFNLSVSEEMPVFVEYNYASTGRYVVIVNVTSENLSAFKDLNIDVGDLVITSLDYLYVDENTVVFEAIILNSGDFPINNINWSFNTGEDTHYAASLFTLSDNENISIVFENNYSSYGAKNYNFTAFTANKTSSKTGSIELKELDIINFSNIYSNSTNVIFEFIVKNLFSTSKDFGWSIATNDTAGIIRSTDTITLADDENTSILFEHNFSASGTYQITVTANTSAANYSESISLTI